MPRTLTLCLAAIVATAASQALASSDNPRTDTETQANSTEQVPGTFPETRYSNWPALPERHAGRSYSQLVHTTSGVRERNFESGR